jgi:hypothetical protein
MLSNPTDGAEFLQKHAVPAMRCASAAPVRFLGKQVTGGGGLGRPIGGLCPT